jgi:hypothetical protein
LAIPLRTKDSEKFRERENLRGSVWEEEAKFRERKKQGKKVRDEGWEREPINYCCRLVERIFVSRVLQKPTRVQQKAKLRGRYVAKWRS